MNVTHDLYPNHYLVTHTVGPSQDGIRLDRFLKERYRRRSREKIQESIAQGIISIKRAITAHAAPGKAKPSSPLLSGDQVLVLTERKAEPDVCFDYRVLYEDEYIFVIDKPTNLPVHPAGRYFFNTLIVHLRTQGFTLPLAHEREYFLAHRIDRETSGVLVLTKDKDACTHIIGQFAKRITKKTYLAVAHGHAPEIFTVAEPMGRAKNSRIRLKMDVVPVEEGGQTAHTDFRCLQHFKDARGREFSLLECSPRTGRQHQIRLHLLCAGHPIVGDKLYGVDESQSIRFFEKGEGRESDEPAGGIEFYRNIPAELWDQLILPRHALHAAKLAFEHPKTGKWLEFTSPLPTDLAAFISNG
ncbi:MAG: RluA family pseudouridine synthase [Bacteriovoracia bacterium]